MTKSQRPLFSDRFLSELFSDRYRSMAQEIQSIEPEILLNTSIDDLVNSLAEKYGLDVPQLNEEAIETDQHEVQVDVSHDRSRVIFNRSRPFYVPGIAVTYYIPFDGDGDLFRYTPTSHYEPSPEGVITENEVILMFERTDHDVLAVKSDFENRTRLIRDTLKYMNADAVPYTVMLRENARSQIEARKDKLLKDQGLAANLGFPLRRRRDAPQTYVVPTVRRKARLTKPSEGSAPLVPEPTLDMQEYEHILSVISNMVSVMERSPHVSTNMDEESLRTHFLVQLNGQYEGQATGETFNFEGKTDILIRVEGRNIFIAECKFWKGPESLTKTLNQLLGYASWRDTKTSLLIFNRDRQFSTVLAKIPETVRVHPNFKRDLRYNSETGFRFILHHRDDVNRELILTILTFEVPA